MPIEPWWETNPATTPRPELGMVSPELAPAGMGPKFSPIPDPSPRPKRARSGRSGAIGTA